eukprot:TRINITY_DN6899_c0_g1_i1.p1 TRINITY_DN6899_c0_g1~~TRINITY_DN6899_c0_g1_i1.p1  ORF type:complete len:141 (+),score=28.58 TRINITY_DN6899_c0_g1_i1:65-424(+)
MKFVMWDLGGQDQLRQSWSTYYKDTNAVILVVDSTERERVPLVKKELYKMLEHESLQNAKILVYANKQDKKGHMKSSELAKELNLHNIKTQPWHIQASCALTGKGLYEGMDWISQQVKQ